ncbi:MAG: HD domain-containing phosphohydrolase, partial [Caldimonas sp.]
MKVANHTDVIDVQALRVGMFVHLDVGWMSHPFPLSSFRITSPAQVATIRSLGLARVRWSPQQSDLSEPEPEPAVAVASGPGGVTDAAANDPQGADDGDGTDTEPGVLASAAQSLAPAAAPDAGRERALRLDAQREALAVCQRQYGEAARACRHVIEIVPARPHDARGEAEALGRSLVDKMLGEQDLCIRMLGEGAGDKASMHSMNVAIISLLMGRCFGFSADEMLDLGVGALLHDVGKIDQPTRMRHRDESFSPSEVRVYEEHVELGLAQARRMGLSPGATAIVGQHHEHADGSGFPARLNSDRMTMGARIVALVNRYDNLCNPHLLARAMTPHESLSLLFAQGRRKFDTSILGAFIKMMGVYPPGSLVQLTDDRYALVVAVNSSRPLKPSVLLHDAGTKRDEALVLDLETTAGLGIRRSLKPQQLAPTALEYLAPAK